MSWISVDDKLPVAFETHVLATNGREIRVVYRVPWFNKSEWFEKSSNEFLDVTHWMPLPNLPKEEK